MADKTILPTAEDRDQTRFIHHLGCSLLSEIRPGLMALRMLTDGENDAWSSGGLEGDELREAVQWITDHILSDVHRLSEHADRYEAPRQPDPSTDPVSIARGRLVVIRERMAAEASK